MDNPDSLEDKLRKRYIGRRDRLTAFFLAMSRIIDNKHDPDAVWKLAIEAMEADLAASQKENVACLSNHS